MKNIPEVERKEVPALSSTLFPAVWPSAEVQEVEASISETEIGEDGEPIVKKKKARAKKTKVTTETSETETVSASLSETEVTEGEVVKKKTKAKKTTRRSKKAPEWSPEDDMPPEAPWDMEENGDLQAANEQSSDIHVSKPNDEKLD
jgi:hypothetical protein